MVYVLAGGNSSSRYSQFKKIKQEFLSKETEDFNLDALDAKALTLKDLQLKLLCLPVRSAKRIVLLNNAQILREEIKEFILGYAKRPYKQVVFILDFERQEKKDAFLNGLIRYSKVFRFPDEVRPDAFTLSRQITLKNTGYALKLLAGLLELGQKPEMIMGGLRHSWENDTAHCPDTKRRLRLLLNCDLEIKTGRLKPDFALEKLVIGLCGPAKPLHHP